jgi:hypothetical protein
LSHLNANINGGYSLAASSEGECADAQEQYKTEDHGMQEKATAPTHTSRPVRREDGVFTTVAVIAVIRLIRL